MTCRPTLPRWVRTLSLGPLLMIVPSLIPITAHAQPALSAEERRIVEFADGRREEAVALLERAVSVKSATENLAGVREVGEVFAEEFRTLGFETRWEEMPPEMRRAGHLIAERKGTKGKRLLLIGHLDTVLEGPRFVRSGSRAKGPGTNDMKGGDVIVLEALRALHSAGALDDRRVIAIFTGDEENAGLPIARSRASLIEAAKRSDAALAFEEVVNDTATVARRGVSSWTLTVSGVTGHSSAIFDEKKGSGAIFEAARILEGFHKELRGERGLTFNPSLFLGGTAVRHDPVVSAGSAEGKTNVIPREAVIEGDLRFLSESQREEAEARMKAMVKKNHPKTSAQIHFTGEYPAMAPTDGNYALLAVLDRASRDLGLGGVKALDPVLRGAGDISFVAPYVDGLDGLGAKGEGAHTKGEWVDLDSLPIQIKRAAILIYRLTRQGS